VRQETINTLLRLISHERTQEPQATHINEAETKRRGMQAFLKEVVQLKDLDQKLPDFFPDYLEELVTVDEQEEKKDEQMMMRAGSGLVNCKDFGGA
jgi:hypothetical protein